jgi:hypothetical protein
MTQPRVGLERSALICLATLSHEPSPKGDSMLHGFSHRGSGDSVVLAQRRPARVVFPVQDLAQIFNKHQLFAGNYGFIDEPQSFVAYLPRIHARSLQRLPE